MIKKWEIVGLLSLFIFDSQCSLKRLEPSQKFEDERRDVVGSDVLVYEPSSKRKLSRLPKIQFNEGVNFALIDPESAMNEQSELFTHSLAVGDEHGQPFMYKNKGKNPLKIPKSFVLSADNFGIFYPESVSGRNVIKYDFSIAIKKIKMLIHSFEKFKEKYDKCNSVSDLSGLEGHIDMKKPMFPDDETMIKLEKVYKEIKFKKTIYMKYYVFLQKLYVFFGGFSRWLNSYVIPAFQAQQIDYEKKNVKDDFVKILMEDQSLVDALVDENIGFSRNFISETAFEKIWDELMLIYMEYSEEVMTRYDSEAACEERYFKVPDTLIVDGEMYSGALRKEIQSIQQTYDLLVKEGKGVSGEIYVAESKISMMRAIVKWIDEFVSVLKQENEDYLRQQTQQLKKEPLPDDLVADEPLPELITVKSILKQKSKFQ